MWILKNEFGIWVKNRDNNGLTERQTGEGFKSAAPPDCRVTG